MAECWCRRVFLLVLLVSLLAFSLGQEDVVTKPSKGETTKKPITDTPKKDQSRKSTNEKKTSDVYSPTETLPALQHHSPPSSPPASPPSETIDPNPPVLNAKPPTTSDPSPSPPPAVEHVPGPFLSEDDANFTDGYIPNGYSSNKTDEWHEYYNSTTITDPLQADALWIEVDAFNETIIHDMLSESYRRAATVNLTFNFPFYGHPIHNVTIATGGFLYVGYALHMWLAATQYIAPLMANFKASNNTGSSIRYFDNGTVFVVEWRNMSLEDKPEAGPFSFQAILHKSGDMAFVYKDIPLAVSKMSEKNHPVKVGISDAYLFHRVVFFLKRKTIYEYHSINKKTDQIQSHSAIVLTALPTCISLTTCDQCTSAHINFNCSWCQALNRCSSGVDRHRQSWLQSKCEDNPTEKDMCPIGPNVMAASRQQNDGGGANAGVTVLLVLVALFGGVACWLVYAYRNPRSASGQFLIKYRPSQWKRHGEARYIAAASLHI